MALFLLASLASCGKDNKSGKRGAYGLNSLNTYGTYNGTSVAYRGVSIQQIINENPCRNGGYNQRFRITIPAQVNTRIPDGDVYVGVTYSGDVAVLVGTPQGPAVEAYLCGYGQSQVTAVGFTPLPISTCRIKQMNLTLVSPQYGPVAAFGSMQGGSSMGRPFTACM